ncbi:MAG: FecR domain-containing protein, partial [Bacteroidota bacterium]
MSKKDTNEYYANLAAKYLSGNTTPAEVQELEAWVSTNSDNKEQFEEYKKVWLLTKIEQNRKAIDIAGNWQQVQQQLVEKEAKVVPLQPKKQRINWLSIAATIALVLIGSWVYFTYFQNQELYITNTQNEPQTIELADGSEVILNQAASIRFIIDKQEKQRAVELTGDAFFEVVRDEKMPFVIQAAEVEVEVLGTAFYVDARAEEDAIQVMVASGKVAVRADEKEQVLNPNEQAVYSKSTQLLEK